MKHLFKALLVLLSNLPVMLWSQAIQSHGAHEDPGVQHLEVKDSLPQNELSAIVPGDVSLREGLFNSRRNLTKAYLFRLSTRNLLQNHMLEAGMRIDDPSENLHQGWEAPHYQLRGHFAGHWLSAAAHYSAIDQDALLAARVDEVIRLLGECQERNGGEWIGSIPEKYFEMLEKGQAVWSPQYTLHKTMMGLLDAYVYLGNEDALVELEKAADWFDTWTQGLIERGRGEVVYSGECAGMLELWANLYAITENPKYLEIASRYAMPDLFKSLLAGKDALSNDHANASVPWIQGAARLYEVTGDERYREVVETFWKVALLDRGMFATTGNNAGEFWIPPHQFGKFLGSRTQEHCTVYNMIRVADFLFRWTGDSQYSDYIERALFNGILAQQNPHTGMISYFLPLQPGARKDWGTETNDFWCCHGSLVQAQSMYEDLIYYTSNEGISVSQFIPSQSELSVAGKPVLIDMDLDTSDAENNFIAEGDVSRWLVKIKVSASGNSNWALSIRQPGWALSEGTVLVNGQAVDGVYSENGFIKLNRKWKEDTVTVSFEKEITREALPGDERRFAFLDGPIVLAALTDIEPQVSLNNLSLSPQYEHLYVPGQNWQYGHYLVNTSQGAVKLKPLFEIGDETYSVYFSNSD